MKNFKDSSFRKSVGRMIPLFSSFFFKTSARCYLPIS
nr:MAG TPA: hypothetical protein [Caudoviricetes sp.]